MSEDRVREELLATVSHELRTPLTSIIGYAELMEDLGDEELGPTARRLLGIVRRNAARELRLVDDLLTLAFLDEDALPVTRVPVDLAEVVRAVVAEASERAADAGIALGLSAPDPVEVLGDAQRLAQLVDNLVGNALKFTPAGGHVEVRLHSSGPVAVLEVEDTGIGVEEHERERVFERLYRTPRAVAQQVQGAGLGLAIVKAIVTAHDGWIDLQSRPDEGSVFRVALPVAQNSRDSASSMPRSAS